MDSIICLDSSDDETSIPDTDKTNESACVLKRHKDDNTTLPRKEVKRIKPTLMTAKQKIFKDDNDDCFIVDSNIIGEDGEQSSHSHADEEPFIIIDDEDKSYIIDVDEEIEQEPSTSMMNESFTKLITRGRRADPSTNMEQLINKKLITYYHMVKPEFINSESFQKIIFSAIDGIQSNPKLAYVKLSDVLRELCYQQADETIAIFDMSGTKDSRRDDQVERLNKAFNEISEQIYVLENSEVDLADDENSQFLSIEHYKKRACDLYYKMCELSGEYTPSLKRITFKGTKYKTFNNTIQTYLNKSVDFPNLRDVIKLLEDCNGKYKLQLTQYEIRQISEETFLKVGETFQKRRKKQLYNTFNFYSNGSTSDPATEDENLLSKLDENRRNYSIISDVIDQYVEIQDKSTDFAVSADEENQIENNLAALGLGDDGTTDDDEYESEEEQANQDSNTDVSDDEELS